MVCMCLTIFSIHFLVYFQTYREQLAGIEAQYNRLIDTCERLLSNEKIGNRAGIKSDLSRLQVLWNPLKDNISDSLQLLIR